MIILIMSASIVIPLLIMSGFFTLSKSQLQDKYSLSTFECGYSGYSFSRFSFSVQYFMVGMIFLFLDLELCIIMPFFGGSAVSWGMLANCGVFALILLLGLFLEWAEGSLEWVE